MNDQSTVDVRGEKKRYTKPEIRRVSLDAEMAVVVGCKNASRSGPGHPACTATHCKTIGS